MDKVPGKIITFYSYKGGTGRSMILANVAYLLATHPAYRARILMIDWDLEAPGLHRYFDEKPNRSSGPPLIAAREKSKDRQPGLSGAPFFAAKEKGKDGELGLIDYFEQVLKIYQEMAPSGGLPESAAHAETAVAIYDKIRSASLYELHTHAIKDVPNLHLMRAGDTSGADYPHQVRSFQWDDFYLKYGSFFTHFRDHLIDEYDYILIDSRTGVTDTSGICTRIMPEKLVTVFAPNLQNLDGIVDVIRRSTVHRSASRDPRSLQFFPVASRIDPAASNLRTLWWKGGLLNEEQFAGYERIFEALFTELFELDACSLHEYFDATQVPHDSDYAYGEQIAARSRTGIYDRLSIGKACANLTERLVKLKTPWEPLPELKTELEEARRHAAEATEKAEALEQEKVRARKVVGTIAAVTPVAVIGAAAAFVPAVLSDTKFIAAAVLLGITASAGAFLALRQLLPTESRHPGLMALWRVGGALLAAVAVGVWWYSPISPSKPSSRAAVQLRELVGGVNQTIAQLTPNKTISIQTTKAVQDAAGALAAADPKYQNLLLLTSNDGNVPLMTFLSAYDLLPYSGQFVLSAPEADLAVQFVNGIGQFRFGTKYEEVIARDVSPVKWEQLPIAVEYHNTQVRYLTILLTAFSASSTNATLSTPPKPNRTQAAENAGPVSKANSLYDVLPWFHPCWNGNNSITFFFTQSDGLIRISVRFFPDDCKDKLSLLENFARQFWIQFDGLIAIPSQVELTPAPPYSLKGPSTTLLMTNGPSISSLEVFVSGENLFPLRILME